MSDEPSTPRSNPESNPGPAPDLSSALHALALDARSPAPGTGADVRRRAGTRRRRRHAALVGGGAVAAAALVAGLVVGLGDDSGSRPAPPAAPSTSAGPTAPAATADLARRELSVAGRKLPLSSGRAKYPTKPGRMTVVAKHRSTKLSGNDVGLGETYDAYFHWVLELRDAEGRTNYVVALTYDEKSVGERDVTHGWLGLRLADAKWLYGKLSPGSVITIEGAAPGTSG
ncbi:L,D-transpeptidase [Streptomyces alboflavus]|uniref:L,D-transpeptidase n=1 Tax=Streptomyces alboflavus TaxID=67267 RepID=UPI00368818D1